ncbi:MAG: 16S rRNA methyltransferase [Gammaproteobacteria bacterium SG8_11]|nr:MAG: 16S rRNA methyltransferase [Gammaproteobacteria bacterium SG8_11]
MNPRTVAAIVIRDVVSSGVQLNSALLQHGNLLRNSADQPLLQELCYGVLRWWFRLEETAAALMQKPLKQKDLDVFCLLLVGLYQLQFMRIPPHAAVSETVNAVRQLKKSWADKMINAVLRRQLREPADEKNFSEQAQCAHPDWLLRHLQAAWPQHWQAVIQANNERPPMSLRINRQKTSRTDYLRRLQQQAMPAIVSEHAPQGLILEQAVNVERLPGFAHGLVSVQDTAAQLAADLLQVEAGQRVLDVCAAPGGKTAHILETAPELAELVALDIDPQRLRRVEENLQRLELTARLICGDATNPQAWWDGEGFDRILLDAPCSATGVIRRHPDIKVLRKARDVEQASVLQQQILEAIWPLLKPGGMLLYATCSVLPEENEALVARFVERNNNACYQRLDARWGHDRTFGRQIFAGEHDMDGFYYARILKRD